MSDNSEVSSTRRGATAWRWLVFAMAIVTVPLGVLLAWKLNDWREQQQVADSVERLGGKVAWSRSTDSANSSNDQERESVQTAPAIAIAHDVIRVDLSGTPISDADLSRLSRLSELRELDLRETGVTDEGLAHLQSLGRLREVDLRATKVTLDGVARLRESLPDVEIRYDTDPRRIALPRATPAFLQRGLRRTIEPGPPGSGLGSKAIVPPRSLAVASAPDSTASINPTDDNSPAMPAVETASAISSPDPALGRRDVRPEMTTESAIDLGVAYLARNQMPDGRWTLAASPNTTDESPTLQADVAATGLALLSFLGAGVHHQDETHGQAVSAGIKYLIDNQQPSGSLFAPLDDAAGSPVWFYSHGIATLALCEAYGMTQDEMLQSPAQRALDFIADSQHKSLGGWRYAPGVESDTSVTGWMMMALQSGRLAGLHVSGKTLAGVQSWLDRAQASPDEPHLYVYNPLAPNTLTQQHGRRPNETMSSVGLLLRLYFGSRRGDPMMQQGAAYLLEHPAQLGTARQPLRDSYYWYYATQVLLHMGGDDWQAWNAQIHPLLVDSQIKEGELAGSWDPRQPVPDRWAPFAGRHYVTTMNLLTLQVYYRHLPLYEDTAR